MRDYGEEGQLGLEPTPEEYVEKLVGIFSEVRRVLRDDGTCWLVIGDSYYNYRPGKDELPPQTVVGHSRGEPQGAPKRTHRIDGLKEKDLVGIPWMVAFALRDDGWYLRSRIVWAKGCSGDYTGGSCMPESVTDRPTSATECIFLLSKNQQYFYDEQAVRELGHNLRNVWLIAPDSYPDAHFAVYGPDLIRPCIRAGTSVKGCCSECGAPRRRIVEKGAVSGRKDFEALNTEGQFRDKGLSPGRAGERKTRTIGWQPTCDCGHENTGRCVVLDPFFGAGTTGLVAVEEGRRYIGIDISEEYCRMAKERIDEVASQPRLITEPPGVAGEITPPNNPQLEFDEDSE